MWSIAFYVYIVTNHPRCTVLYTGHTDDLDRRAADHAAGPHLPAHEKGFAARHNCTRLVWWEGHETREAALRREATIKRWKRAWKMELVESLNPDWDDLAPHHKVGRRRLVSRS